MNKLAADRLLHRRRKLQQVEETTNLATGTLQEMERKCKKIRKHGFDSHLRTNRNGTYTLRVRTQQLRAQGITAKAFLEMFAPPEAPAEETANQPTPP
jgi:hypothetical protein